jgi:hypothetical protein
MTTDRANDTIEGLAEEIRLILERAVRIGEARAVQRVIAAIGQPLPLAASLPNHAPATRSDESNSLSSELLPTRRAPSGAVKGTVRDIVMSRNGVTAADISDYAKTVSGFNIKPSSLRMALISLRRESVITQQDGKWFPVKLDGTLGTGTPSQYDDLL